MPQDAQALLDRIPDAQTHALLSRIPGGEEPAAPPVQGPELPLPFEPLMQSQTGSTGGPPAGVNPQLGPGTATGGPLTGLEDVVRGAELGTGAMAGFAGRALARARNVLAPGDTTRAEQQRRIERAGGLGRALEAQAETHPAPTTLPGQILQGAGGVAPILAASAIDPLLGLGALGATAGSGVENRYDQVLRETGSEAKATEAAVTEIPLQALYLAPVGRLLGGPSGSFIRKAIDGLVSGVVGPGSARVLGEIAHEQITKEDAANLGDALKRGLSEAGQEAKVNAPLFMFLSAAAHGKAVEEAPPPEAAADKLAGGQEPTPATSGTTPNIPGTQIPASLESGEATPLGQLPALPPEAAPLPKELTPSELPTVSPLQGPPPRIIPQTQPEARGEAGPVEAQPTVQLGAPAKEPLAVKPEVEGEAPQPVEPVKAEQPATSTKNAIMEEERAARGVTPLEETVTRARPETMQMAETATARDPSLADRVIKGEAVQGLERDVREAVLLREKVKVKNEADRVRDALIEAQAAGDKEAIDALQAQRDNITERRNAIDLATKREGTEWGRSGVIRQAFANADYSLADVTAELRASKGSPLTPEEHEKAADLSRRLLAAEKQVEEIEAGLRSRAEAKVTAKQPAKIISFLDAQAEQARARLAAKRGQAMGGIPFDPQDILDVARIAASHIAHGIDAAVQLVKDFGEEIRPHLEEILAKAKQINEEAGKRSGLERAAITRAGKTAAKLRAKTAAGDFEPEPKPEPMPMTPERLAAKTDLEEARKKYEAAKAAYKFKNRTLGQKALGAGRELLNIPKQLLTGFDLSATLFQGGMLSASHPVISTKALGDSIRALMSERKTLEIDTALRNRPNAAMGEKAGLELTQLEGPMSAHEEHMRSNWAGKIPFGIGKGIEASNRAFTTFLNVQRAMAFDKMVDALPHKSPEAQNAMANFVNVATGRGYTPARLRGAISAAANVLWSPRLLLSRFQLLAGQPLYRGTAATRTAIAGEYAKSLMALGAIYTISKLAGADIEEDPRSSDFGKIRIGDTRIDPLIGLSQITTFLWRTLSGETKSASGKIEPLRPPIIGEGKGPGYGQSNTADVIFRFLRTKFSPTVGIPMDLLAGKDVVGQPVTPTSLATNTMVPMAFQDVYQAMRDRGMSEGAAIGLLSILGMHVQVYQDKTPAPPRLRGPSMPRLR